MFNLIDSLEFSQVKQTQKKKTKREKRRRRVSVWVWIHLKMDDEVVQRVFQEGGRDYFQQQPSTSSSSSSILQSLPLHVVIFFNLKNNLI